MDHLPIDAVLAQIGQTLQAAPFVVLEAEPGAGKTTRVPRYLAQHFPGKLVLVAEPRRLAAKLAATRVAHELGEPVGDRVGYQVRTEKASSSSTQVLYVTDGVLLRRLLSDPELDRVALVVLDEFHERRLHTDLSLALLKRLQQSRRPDLKLLVMSATLDGAELADYLDGCERIQCQGRSYPLSIKHATAPDERPLSKQVVSGARELLQTTQGDLLVFLPGAHEIVRAAEELQKLAEQHQLLITPLHGELSLAEQTLAVQPNARRKIVLSTNVAESSVTVDNVSAVIDSGWSRVMVHDAWSGMDRLGLHKISQASAIQRAGRAGRTSAGQVLRLFTRGDFNARPSAERPEIERLDLSECLLVLLCFGVKNAGELAWLTPPPESSIATGFELLRLLGAIDAERNLTPIGRRIADFPVHPRLGRIILESEASGLGADGCLAAALLSERDIRRRGHGLSGPVQRYDQESDSDVLELIELYRDAEQAGFKSDTLRNLGLDRGALQRVRDTFHRLSSQSRAGPKVAAGTDSDLLKALMTGFVDRLAQRTPVGRGLLLQNGKTAELSSESVVHRAPLVVCLVAGEQVQADRRSRVVVRLASAVDEQWLFDQYIDQLEATDEYQYNPKNERVERVSRIRFGRITLDETKTLATPSAEAGSVLYKALLAKGARSFDPDGEVETLLLRLGLLREHAPHAGLAAVGELGLERLLEHACKNLVSLAELSTQGLLGEVWSLLPPEIPALLEREVPAGLTLAGGRRLPIHYAHGQRPFIASRLQDFFSMTETPTILGGKLTLSVHLLAPNRRAVQITEDLAGFWLRHYPALRKQLMRRYPRHAWPEDGARAAPPSRERR